ncbi:MAG TPA: class I SAM-dependent methyltransferase [Candidatus Paceibacterota bacterium]
MESNNSKKERINNHEKIGPTAWMIAYRRTFSDIPYAQEIFDVVEKIRIDNNEPSVPDELKKPERSSLFEARYKLVSRLISESNVNQILEIASGLSPRGLAMTSDRTVQYVEVDLHGVMNLKRQVAGTLKKHLSTITNLFFEVGDALNRSDLLRASEHFRKGVPLAIINEGLLAYLTLEEKTILAKNIHEILSLFGGVWITPDIIWPENKKGDTATPDNYMQNMQKLTGAAIGQNRFKSEEEAKIFFENMGFQVESRPFTEIYDQLTSPKKLGQTAEDVKEIIGSSVAFVMRIKNINPNPIVISQ